METIQEIIDTIKQWPATIWWVMGALFIIPRFWDTPPRKKRNKDKMTDDKNNDLKSSNMTDKKEFGGNLMEEGVIMWAIFTKEGKAALRMDYEVHPENGKVGYGRLLSPDVSVLHEILTPDDADRFLSLPEYGISIRIRMRVRYPGTDGYLGDYTAENFYHGRNGVKVPYRATKKRKVPPCNPENR